MRFRTEILSNGKTAAGIEIPLDVLDALGTSRKPAVSVSLNGYTYRSTVATVNGMYMVGVSNDVRTAAGVAAGQVVDVDIELDTEPRVVAVPPDLAAALDAEPEARRFFETLSYSNKRRIVMPIDDAKSPETRRAPDREVRGVPARGSDLAPDARDPARATRVRCRRHEPLHGHAASARVVRHHLQQERLIRPFRNKRRRKGRDGRELPRDREVRCCAASSRVIDRGR